MMVGLTVTTRKKQGSGVHTTISRPWAAEPVHELNACPPPSFEFPTSTKVEAWTPLAFDPKDMHGRSRRARDAFGRAGRRAR